MHAHVIYGVDDGPQTREDMERMLYSAKASGVKRLYCTSHYSVGGSFPETVYREHLKEAREWCRENAPDLTLYSGAEIFADISALPSLRQNTLPTLEGTNLILLEFPIRISARDILRIAQKCRECGYQPILAHAERYPSLHKIQTVQTLKNAAGALIQINAQSVFDPNAGCFQKARTRRLLHGGLADCVSSDAHNTSSRPFCLEYAYHWLKTNISVEAASSLCGGRMERYIAP